jgi:hypothetical protein
MRLLRDWLSTYHGWWVKIVSKHPVPWVIAIGTVLLGGMVLFDNLHFPLWIALGIWAAITPGFFAAMSVISGKQAENKGRRSQGSNKRSGRGKK